MQEPLPVTTRRPFPDFLQAVVLLILAWFGILAVAVGFVVIHMVIRGTLEAVPPAPLLLVSNSVGFALVLVVGWKWSGVSARRLFPFHAFSARLLGPLVLFSLGGVVLMAQTEVWIRLLPLPDALWALMQRLDDATLQMMKDSFWLSLAAVTVVAPITEELFFRGLLLRGFLARYGPVRAIAASSAFFAVAHLTPTQLVPAFLVGLFLGWVIVQTQNLWLSLVTHALLNGLGVLSVRVFPEPEPVAGVKEAAAAAPGAPFWVVILAIAAVGVAIVWVKRLLRERGPNAAI